MKSFSFYLRMYILVSYGQFRSEPTFENVENMYVCFLYNLHILLFFFWRCIYLLSISPCKSETTFENVENVYTRFCENVYSRFFFF